MEIRTRSQRSSRKAERPEGLRSHAEKLRIERRDETCVRAHKLPFHTPGPTSPAKRNAPEQARRRRPAAKEYAKEVDCMTGKYSGAATPRGSEKVHRFKRISQSRSCSRARYSNRQGGRTNVLVCDVARLVQADRVADERRGRLRDHIKEVFGASGDLAQIVPRLTAV